MKKLLITGASGFIGAHCLNKAMELDFDEIHAVSREKHDSTDKITWHKADLLDETQCQVLISSIRPTHILHAAWEVTPRLYATSPANLDWLRASILLAQFFGEQGGQYFVGVGTSAEYAPDEALCYEDKTPINPASIYGQSKAAFWLALQAAAQTHGFNAGWGRVFVPYGAGDPPERLIPMLMGKLSAGEEIKTTHGRQIRDFILVDDIAALFALMLKTETPGVYNIGSNAPIAVREVIEILAKSFDRLDLIEFDAIPLSPKEPMVLAADMGKTKDALGWVPQTDIRQALAALVETHRKEAA